jgi:hypothetical protein
VLVLDTFEEVQYASERNVEHIWLFLEELQKTLPRLRVVIAGRSQIEGRKTRELPLSGLDAESAAAYLQGRGIQNGELVQQIVRTVGLSPMNLQLAADVTIREGAQAGANLGVKTREFLIFRLDDSQIQRQLYKRVLNYIHDDRVRALAHPGLLLRRITPELILDVLAEPCGLEINSLKQAQELFNELRREISLVSEDSNGALVHRADLRKLMLRLLEEDDPVKARVIHQRAVDYYERNSANSIDRAEEIYHRLCLDEAPDLIESRWMPGVESSLRTAETEFSGARRAWLASRLGSEVNEETRQLASLEDWEKLVQRSAGDLIALRSFTAALDELRSRPDRTAASPIFSLEALVLSRLSRWAESIEVLDSGIRRALVTGERRQVISLVLQAAEVADGVTRKSEGIARLSFLRAVRQGIPQGCSGVCLPTLQSQVCVSRWRVRLSFGVIPRISPRPSCLCARELSPAGWVRSRQTYSSSGAAAPRPSGIIMDNWTIHCQV